MTKAQFNAMSAALRAAASKFPGCPIANCKCNSKRGEWRKDCACMCHFTVMGSVFGKGKWTLSHFQKAAAKRLAPTATQILEESYIDEAALEIEADSKPEDAR
jgi:hypothetical protein